MTIAQLSRETGVAPTTIHYYLKQGLLPRPYKTAASRSLYSREHAAILKTIRELKAAGLSLDQIERKLENRVGEANSLDVDLAAEQYEHVHNRILALATEEFCAKGYRDTHVAPLVKKLGITPNQFYRHFKSKHSLFGTCMSSLIEENLARIDAAGAATKDSGERLLRLALGPRFLFDLGADALAVMRMEGTQEDSELRKPVEQAWSDIAERITNELLDGTSPERDSPPVPDELLAYSLLGSFEQIVVRSSLTGRYSFADLLRTHLWMFLALQAARRGDIDIDTRLSRYEELIEDLSAEAQRSGIAACSGDSCKQS